MFLNPDKTIKRNTANLPHWQQGETWIFVTWRLADSLPKSVVERINEQKTIWKAKHPPPWDEAEQKEHSRLFTLGFEQLLDDAHGKCVLAQQPCRKIVSDALRHFHGERYHLDSFVIMPNHVHLLFHPLGEIKLEAILQTWKRFTAREISNLLGTTGSIWQREYWDRLIRSEKQFAWTRNYIFKNPEKLPPGSFELWRRDLQSLSQPEQIKEKTDPPRRDFKSLLHTTNDNETSRLRHENLPGSTDFPS
jgi:type I restriction enzyme R subunit